MHLFRLLLLFVVLVEKLIVLRKAERNQFADLGAMTEPGQKFFSVLTPPERLKLKPSASLKN